MRRKFDKPEMFFRTDKRLHHEIYLSDTRKVAPEKLKQTGEEAYNAEQIEKRQILDRLLADYNDGRKKTLFCLAANQLGGTEVHTI